jgi:hypothetical protein
MALGQGFQGIFGVKKESVYGTAVAVTEAIPFISESFDDELEKHEDEVLRGKAGKGESLEGNRRFPFTLPCKLTYEDVDLLIAIKMGAAGVPVVNGALFDNTYSLAENLAYSLTGAAYKGVSVWEYAGIMIDTMKISGEANKPLNIEFGGVAKALDRASVINTAVILQALDTEDVARKIMFSDLEFKIAPQATALLGETEKGINSFDLNSNNNLQLDGFDNRELLILKPERNGNRDVKLNFKIPRYEADTYIDWKNSGARLHAYLKFTYGSYKFDIHIPRLKIDKATAPIAGPGLIEQNIECTCFRDPGSLSASFTCTDEYEIAVTNARSVSPLA